MGIGSPQAFDKRMKPNIWVSSSQARELLTKQLVTWPLAAHNYEALRTVRTHSFDMGGFTVRVQFNPARIASSGAKVDNRSIRERTCFLCPDHLPVEQERLPFGFHYLVLCNPYPIFPQHFTIASRKHVEQLILPRFTDFLDLTRRLSDFTIFYNGPRAGASAPDHAHFQAVTRGVMPIDTEMDRILAEGGSPVLTSPHACLQVFTHYLRNGFAILSSNREEAMDLFQKLYDALPLAPGETEPRMNIFGMYQKDTWKIWVIPRRQHRPWQYEATGDAHLLSSPGAADMGGLFILVRQEDFEKISVELLRDVYRQVCFNDTEIQAMASRIKAGSK